MKEEWKVFIRGNKDRGEEVIKALTDLGGKGDVLNGLNKDCIYFIDHDGIMDFAYLVSETAQIIMDNYTELHLPEKWKDGDVLVDRHDSQIMALYEFVSDQDADLFNAHILLNGDMIVLHSLEVRKRFRLATAPEIEKFHEILHEHHKDWDAEKKQLVDLKWKPSEGDSFYAVSTAEDCIRKYEFGLDTYTQHLVRNYNCFKTREEAETMAEKIKELLKEEWL